MSGISPHTRISFELRSPRALLLAAAGLEARAGTHAVGGKPVAARPAPHRPARGQRPVGRGCRRCGGCLPGCITRRQYVRALLPPPPPSGLLLCARTGVHCAGCCLEPAAPGPHHALASPTACHSSTHGVGSRSSGRGQGRKERASTCMRCLRAPPHASPRAAAAGTSTHIHHTPLQQWQSLIGITSRCERAGSRVAVAGCWPLHCS